jgi:hypothetical protein
MRDIKLAERDDNKYQRKDYDHDPVEPWNWASLGIRSDPVEIVSYPIPAEQDGADIIEHRATVMVRMTVGEPGSIKEVPLRHIAAFHPSRHEWGQRPRHYYSDSPTDFVFTD